VTAAARTLSPAARALLADLQGQPAMGEGSLKAWGSRRRPQLTLTQVETRAAELVEANLVTRELRPDGRSIYRARERTPEPPPVEVVTTLEPSPTPPPASVKRARKAPSVAPEAPAPCAECTRLAEALLSWEDLWGVNGTDLAAMEARIEEAETRAAQAEARVGDISEGNRDLRAQLIEAREKLMAVMDERDRLAGKVTTPAPPVASPVYGAQLALDVLATTRGTSRREVATRAGISLASAGKALAALAAEGLAYESTPGLWRRR